MIFIPIHYAFFWLSLWLWFAVFGCDPTLSGAHLICDEVPLGMSSGAGPLALPETQVKELHIVYVVLVFLQSLATNVIGIPDW